MTVCSNKKAVQMDGLFYLSKDWKATALPSIFKWENNLCIKMNKKHRLNLDYGK